MYLASCKMLTRRALEQKSLKIGTCAMMIPSRLSKCLWTIPTLNPTCRTRLITIGSSMRTDTRKIRLLWATTEGTSICRSASDSMSIFGILTAPISLRVIEELLTLVMRQTNQDSSGRESLLCNLKSCFGYTSVNVPRLPRNVLTSGLTSRLLG